MILGHVTFGEVNYAPNITTPPSSLLLANAEYDQVRVDAEIKNAPISFEKKGWTGYTILQATFEKNNLDCGSLGDIIENLSHIILKRKRYDDKDWVIVDKTPFSEIYDGVYTFVDKFADPAEKYEYAIVPYAEGAEYNYFIKDVVTEMETCLIYDKDTRYELYYDFSFDDFSHNMPNEQVETMGNRYPIVTYNNVLNYINSGITCLIYAGEDGEIDFVKEKRLRRKIMEFLTNRKPKAIKSYAGINMMVAITGTPSLSPHARGVFNLSFDFVEIGDMNNQRDMYKNNFIDIPEEAGGQP